MPFRPVRLGQQIVNEIDSARSQKCERLVKMTELAGPRIGVNQIECAPWCVANEFGAIDDVKGHSTIGGEMALGDGRHGGIGIDGIEVRRGIHAREQREPATHD